MKFIWGSFMSLSMVLVGVSLLLIILVMVVKIGSFMLYFCVNVIIVLVVVMFFVICVIGSYWFMSVLDSVLVMDSKINEKMRIWFMEFSILFSVFFDFNLILIVLFFESLMK